MYDDKVQFVIHDAMRFRVEGKDVNVCQKTSLSCSLFHLLFLKRTVPRFCSSSCTLKFQISSCMCGVSTHSSCHLYSKSLSLPVTVATTTTRQRKVSYYNFRPIPYLPPAVYLLRIPKPDQA